MLGLAGPRSEPQDEEEAREFVLASERTFKYVLADALHKTAGEIERIPRSEFNEWRDFYAARSALEADAAKHRRR